MFFFHIFRFLFVLFISLKVVVVTSLTGITVRFVVCSKIAVVTASPTLLSASMTCTIRKVTTKYPSYNFSQLYLLLF